MKKLTVLAATLGTLLTPYALAQTLAGKISDADGLPVVGAKVQIMGTNLTQTTDNQGRFQFDKVRSGTLELHLSAPRFAHLNTDVEVPETGLSNLNLTMINTSMEVVDVTATPFHSSALESSIPVSVLAGDNLRMRQAATLGDTLKNEVGVHSNFYASVASSPIIRGLDGPRVMITQNGLGAGDASRVGPDHVTAAEASTATQIEVLRGPSTLFYGSGAIGGVVNVVDNRVPKDTLTRGEATLERDSVNNQKLMSASLNTGTDNVGVYVDGFWRENDDYRIPGHAETESEHDEHEHHDEEGGYGTVENTASESKGFTLGSSYLLDNGFVGFSYGRLEREYGIPGHAHGEEHGHEEDHEDEHGHTDEMEESVYADMKQDRVQILSELSFDHAFISGINSKFAYTDYQHAEVEDGQIGTLFKNTSKEARIELLHKHYHNWRGGLSLHYKQSDFEAQGDEAFSPPSDTEMLALGWMEERHFGDVLVQLGARIEHVEINADQVRFPESAVHGDEVHHDDEVHEDEPGHEDEHGDEVAEFFTSSKDFTPYSLSAGLVWDFHPGYNMAVSLSRSQRAPSAAELFSFGPHIGTNSFEVGAIFELVEEEGERFLSVSDNDVELETSTNLDISLRKVSGDLGFVLNAFYNQADDFYYQQATGLFAGDGHEHEEEEHAHEEEEHGAEEELHADELPVYLFAQEDVVLHGFEAQVNWQISAPLKLVVQGDYIRARLKQGGDLPRIPPLRLAARLNYEYEQVSADIGLTRYFKQDKTAELESETSGYTLLDANVTYHVPVGGNELAFYLKGSNLTDEEARVHTSFLKDIAPLPGRSLAVGVRGYF
ncbi:TonB-dependent receptor [Lacimicrobium sp. SS2-24]|uniref:TonB-dependent receptor n=1 Tax=Lacimicrobium sp. SS2-24 TaxID=2005569 RepID=UPI000B4AF089|nr:TonB-dependent receptor [Lacimicrobium sp. SS2-24]